LAAEAYAHLRQVYPFLVPLFDHVGDVPVPTRTSGTVDDAVIKIVIGQMLSGKAARSIHERVLQACAAAGCPAWELPDETLRSAGLSGRKVRTIREFAAGMTTRADEIAQWPTMPFQDLRRSVSSFWGLSDWTASILAIFHFGHPDVLPLSDGSIVRAIKYVEQHLMPPDERFVVDLASPYGTYLSMAFYASLDEGFWTAHANARKLTSVEGKPLTTPGLP